jgi:alpha-D-xyloside xylohydrolase
VTTQGVHDGQRQASDEKRVVILTRSAYAGQQRYGAATWSGDIGAAWPVFKAQIPAGLNFCMSGIPYWTTDNGGFFASGRGAQFPEGVRDAAFRELFLRWFQYATFCPILRSHGTSTPREAWQFGDVGDPIYDTLAHFDELRARLVPYSYSLAARTTFEHYTPMRALAMEYPNDQRAHGIVGQFFYGPSLMACPMTEPVYHRPTVIVDQLPSELLVDAEGRPGAITLRLARREQGELASATHRVTALRWPLDVIEPPAGIELAALSVCFEGALNLPTARRYRFEIHAQGQVRFSLADRTLFDGELDPWCIGGTASVVVEAELPAGLTTLLLEYPKNKHETYLSLTAEELLPDGTQRPLGPPERDVYLPVGTWFDFWSGGTLRGGRVVRMAAPLERIPVLTRAGSILPLGPVLEHVSQGPVDPLELRVYPGADARFVLYEDAGDGYGYERGEHAEVELDWCDARRTLCISKRRGSFPGMLAQRTLCVVLVKEGHGSGVARTKKPDAIVVYDGNPREVVL